MTCEPAKTPANLVTDGAFECGTQGWSAQQGTLAVVDGGRSGKALQLTATANGAGQAGIATPIVASTSGKSYCVTAWVKGTVSDARFEVLAPNAGTMETFSTPVMSGSWLKAPMSSNLKVTVAAGGELYLRVRMVNGTASQTLLIDDVDFWESASGSCNER